MIGSPHTLEMLLHAYYSVAPYPRHDTDVAKAGRQYLFANGLIDREDELCTATSKGRFFVEHLLSVPFPVETYRIPDAQEPHP